MSFGHLKYVAFLLVVWTTLKAVIIIKSLSIFVTGKHCVIPRIGTTASIPIKNVAKTHVRNIEHTMSKTTR